MSSFKRRVTSKQSALPPGTKASPASTATLITSTGVPSLDDILGGGLPLSCSLLVLAPDVHSAYGELVCKYFVAQGLVAGQKVVIVDEVARSFAEECMWTPPGAASGVPLAEPDDEKDEPQGDDTKIKIAWRYERMKQFQTTVTSPGQDEFCATFDLTQRVPSGLIEDKLRDGGLACFDLSQEPLAVLDRLRAYLETTISSGPGPGPGTPVRICVPQLASPAWGEMRAQDVLLFLHRLRALLRRYPTACAVLGVPPYVASDVWGGIGWTHKLGWAADGCISFSAFTGDPALTETFPSHHGLVHVHSVPAPHTLLPPSDRFSTLRGLAAGGENNLAFKCMRKRMVIETLHLDAEGGVGERRTAPASASVAAAMEEAVAHGHTSAAEPVVPRKSQPDVEVEVEHGHVPTGIAPGDGEVVKAIKPKPKTKKKVAFHSERPDLYDF
ncbi:hypothetical protein PUNSTDRAFT_57059 [Punctularia strigosozonata HHB-11173 SS5]|uniref:uncharacterized protein n=1 Tax=Punctularia strigosozonata (strain HHB-11173) TaxID=741275 RepID=UPI0004416F5C|nr:uncharacterized protein PUNSTDRAFT_57059 [Punctularia strigosozonata HHB-11173 SS5]EIN13539.1 hypothetical protein PUNSTDRAFT_57059 [Punctularia strigosozonata HHB-11173 SS5]